MTKKLSGAEFKAFYDDPEVFRGEPGDVWLDDLLIRVDGAVYISEDAEPNGDVADIADDAVVEVEVGVLCSMASRGDSLPRNEDLCEVISRWQRARKTVRMVVEVDKGRVSDVKRAIRAAGGKVVS